MQIYDLLFEGSPQPFDEDVVEIAALPVHRDFDISFRQSGDPGHTIELRSLIPFHDLGLAAFCDGFFQRLHTKAGVQCVGEPPCQHLARCPINDRDQIQEATSHGDVGDVATPNMVWPRDRQFSQ